jgi:uncharacterized protein YukE
MGQGDGSLSAAAGLVAEARLDLDRLDRQLAERLAAAQGVWTGSGSTAFQNLGRAWSERQRTIVGALDHFAEALRSTERDNVATDDTQAATFQRAHHRLG